MPDEPAPPRPQSGPLRWWFADRRTGQLVVAQFPNPALWAAVVLAVIGLVARQGSVHDVAHVASLAAFGLWALDEMARGVNPFRRVLGAVVAGLCAWAMVAAS